MAMLCRSKVAFAAALFVVALGRLSAQAGAPVVFTVSMPQPANHIFHVNMRVSGLAGETQDFKMPVWTPGYYRVIDYARNVSNLNPRDSAGHELAWEKTTRNTWRIVTGGAASVTVDYDVYGFTRFGAQNYLDENRAYISPPGCYLYVAGQLRRPAQVTFRLPSAWTRIASGLDGRDNVFSAPDFDVLYDCPTLIGSQEDLRFEAGGVPHFVALENVPESVERPKMLADLKRIVEAATGMMGEVPYKHYTFLMMGIGNGGIEHLDSASISFNGNSLTTENGYRRWLSYVAHEYFHNFNVKRIRPLALGPFDYDAENLTNMLWVSEGLSVYYQDLLLVRAGLITPEQYIEKMQASLGSFESAAGRHYQSATESSWNTWGTSGVGNDRNTTISYYDNGAMLGAMLDLKIRHESGNRKSLDDAMRALYRKYYQEKRRGFTDAEFRAECEAAAGGSLEEVFSYASTTRDPDYVHYFAYAGLALEATSADGKGAYLGVNTHVEAGKLLVVTAQAGSPAEKDGVQAGDEIAEVEGAKATVKVLSDALASRKPGDRLRLKFVNGGKSREAELVLSANPVRTYRFRKVEQPDALAAEVWKDWMRAGK
jgi:predicted metalloprotease with PDZ domain